MPKIGELEDIKKQVEKERAELGKDTMSTSDSSGNNDNKGSAGSQAPAPDEDNEEEGGKPGFLGKLGEIADRMAMPGGSDGSGQPGQQPQAATAPQSQSGPAQLNKQITDIIKRRVDSKISGIQENLKGLEKIEVLEGKINQITDKLNSQMFQPPSQGRPVQGGSGPSIARELASFGEEVDFQTEIYETKRTIAGIAKTLDTLSKKMEYRLSTLEDKSRILERIPDLEERLQEMREKLGPENVQKLRKLIFSSDEIVDEVIPELVNKKLRAKLDPAMNEIRDMQETINDFNSRLSHMKEEVLNLEKLRDEIQELRADKDNIYKELEEDSSRSGERLEILKQNIRKKLETINDRFEQEMKAIRKMQTDLVKNEVGNSFIEIIEPRFADIEKKQEIFDDRVKRMGRVEAELDKKISSLEAPENVKKWLEDRVDRLERGLVSEVKKLDKKSLSSDTALAKISEDLRTFHASMKDIPSRLSNQGNMIDKLLDTKDYFAGRAEALSSENKGLNEKISALSSKLAGLEERLASQESRFADSLNRQRDFLTAAKDDMTRHMNREVAELRKALERKSLEQGRTTLAEFKAEIKRLSSTEEELKALRKSQDAWNSRLQKQVSDLQEALQQASPGLKSMETRVKELETGLKEAENALTEASDFHKASDSVIRSELTRKMEAGFQALQRDMESHRATDARAQLKEFKDELKRLDSLEQQLLAFRSSQEKRTDEISGSLASLSGPLTDLKALSLRAREIGEALDAFGRRFDTEKAATSKALSALENRGSLSEKSLRDLSKTLEQLEIKVNNENSGLQAALARAESDRQSLEKEFAGQRSRVSELIKELKSA